MLGGWEYYNRFKKKRVAAPFEMNYYQGSTTPHCCCMLGVDFLSWGWGCFSIYLLQVETGHVAFRSALRTRYASSIAEGTRLHGQQP